MSAAVSTDPGSARVHRAPSTRQQHTAAAASPSRTHAHRPSADQAGNLANVVRRDQEQSNLAQPRRAESRDADNRQHPSRTDSLRNGPRDQRSDRRQPATADGSAVPPVPTTANGTSSEAAASRAAPPQPIVQRKRTAVTCSTGTWNLGKTIGQGSMGKVKQAKNQETGEQVAIKIVPRQSTEDHRTPAERERAEHSKEIRTAREAAIVSLVHHPYICGMRDVYRTNYHWYMLFEYVNGGQMLDYIISHGRLKEKNARKFARQIASALDYCHKNSIVHRDLKIENILISKTGDIKIIDFGLSNLFSPRDHLKTFCGSLYFAAPELLQAKQYTGPEVDIWSFGVVLYVLVCGKVPFDDQSMPQLHAKIKKGHAEYPPWLTAECKNLIGRMLVTNPQQRATLTEIMNHPWMTKGFHGPPDNFLPPREPLQLPLDSAVIQQMTGFDFGPADYITNQLTRVIESEDYQKAVKNAARRQVHLPEHERNRSMFGFYKRRNSATSRDTLTNPSAEVIPLGQDPINAYSPLISIYYLVREKLEREKSETAPGATSIPAATEDGPIPLPDLPAPPAAYTNSAAPEMKGESTGGRTRPRARTRGEDELIPGPITEKAPQDSKPITSPQLSNDKKESTAGAILRRISTRRKKPEHLEVNRPPPPPAVSVTSPAEDQSTTNAPPPRKSYSTRRPNRIDDVSSSSLNAAQSSEPKPSEQLLQGAAASGLGAGLAPKRFMSLRRAASVDRRKLGRRAPSSEAQDPPPTTSGSDGARTTEKKAHSPPPPIPLKVEEPPLPTTPSGSSMAGRTKSLGHARRESIQARRARREARETDVKEETDAELVAAAETAEASGRGYHRDHRAASDQGGESGEGDGESLKPVYLKGLFSVSTTSTKKLAFIRADIIRVLSQLNVDYTEIKGGFECRHKPSIATATPAPLPISNLPTSPTLNDKTHTRKTSFGALKNLAANAAGYINPEKEKELAMKSPKTPRRDHYNANNNSPPGLSDTESDSGAYGHNNRGKDAAGMTSTHVRDEMSSSQALEFEIFIVKVPFLSLHGIQFKKVDGNIMVYKEMAQEILKRLRL